MTPLGKYASEANAWLSCRLPKGMRRHSDHRLHVRGLLALTGHWNSHDLKLGKGVWLEGLSDVCKRLLHGARLEATQDSLFWRAELSDYAQAKFHDARCPTSSKDLAKTLNGLRLG